jgi:lipopolysaccharide biosynthesis glycosyltransferase
MNNDINILFSCDTNYAMPMTVCITSVFENNKDFKVNVFVFYSNLTEDQKEILIKLAKQYNQNINQIKVDGHYFETAPTLRWSKETYYRLLFNELLPKDLKRIIYFDADTIVNKSIYDLFELKLEDYSISALPEIKSSEQRKRLGLSQNGNYYQAGVLVLDLDKCRKNLDYKKAEEVILSLGEKLLVVDQDIINVIFDGRIKKLDKKFNNCEITNFQKNNFNRFLNFTEKRLIDETVIFHFATSKPWNNLFSGSCEEVWYKYLKLSPYSYLYNQKYSSLKYKILRTGLFKVFFYEYIHLTPTINKLALNLFPKKIYAKLKKYYRKNIK